MDHSCLPKQGSVPDNFGAERLKPMIQEEINETMQFHNTVKPNDTYYLAITRQTLEVIHPCNVNYFFIY